MDNQSVIPTAETQLAEIPRIPPSWQLNERQQRFIEDLWLPEAQAASALADNLAPPGQDAEQHL
ncbi:MULTISPECIES: hypothetical protein [unclassified Serratia (in: enterobacteria)]|uniref:hypothetical protein n=1 Tax=unclassified Serratia (in: enterobacteria) TaxID=2647522 RepID=UPI0012FF4CE1|nr:MULTISPECIES: hypothetical protein [unclassified Serratia (in: enterobacteria)]